MTDQELMQQALDALIDAADSQNWEMQQNIDQHGEWYRRSVNLKRSTTNSQAAIDALRARLANEFNPDWDAMAVMVEEQQRMAKRIEELEAALAQPEPEELGEVIPADEEQLKRIAKLIEPEPVATLFGSLPVYDVPPAKPVAWVENLENAQPHCVTDLKYCSVMQHERGEHLKYIPLYPAPPQREWQTLTENEIKHLWYEACQTNLELTSQLIVHLARNIEAKLKEKNSGTG